ncbi:hypothetical protein BDD12DRAFT_803582 [Trichophaea hybrida]|nr:hypothetical protein BDD12DRAFT_803582 [Trichophaea hybrida]
MSFSESDRSLSPFDDYTPSPPAAAPRKDGNFVSSGGLEALPLELHQLIMAKLSRSDIRALLLTSQALTAVAVHELYRSITLAFGYDIESARTEKLLEALETYKVLVRRVFIVNLDTGPTSGKNDTLLPKIEKLLDELCDTGQLEAIVYHDPSPSCATTNKLFRSRTKVGTKAIARTTGLRFLALGVLNESDKRFLELGLATTELLGLAATFNALSSSKESTFSTVYGDPDMPAEFFVDNIAVTKELVKRSQATLTGLSLDTNAMDEITGNFSFRSLDSLISPDIKGFFEDLSLARVTRLELLHWEVGDAAIEHLVSAIDFSRLVELRLISCLGIREFVAGLKQRIIRLKKLRKFGVSATQEELVELLGGGLILPNQLEVVYLDVIYNNAPIFVAPLPVSPTPEFINALLNLGDTIQALKITTRRGGVAFNGAGMGRLMNRFKNISELAIAVDFTDWVCSSCLPPTFSPLLTYTLYKRLKSCNTSQLHNNSTQST